MSNKVPNLDWQLKVLYLAYMASNQKFECFQKAKVFLILISVYFYTALAGIFLLIEDDQSQAHSATGWKSHLKQFIM